MESSALVHPRLTQMIAILSVLALSAAAHASQFEPPVDGPRVNERASKKNVSPDLELSEPEDGFENAMLRDETVADAHQTIWARFHGSPAATTLVSVTPPSAPSP